MHRLLRLARRFRWDVILAFQKNGIRKWFLTHGFAISPSVKLPDAPLRSCIAWDVCGYLSSTRKKNTLEMNKVKRHLPGRPRRSQGEVDLPSVGLRVRQVRGAATQEEFARALNISQAQLSKYELGQSALPLSLLVKLAERSGQTTDWILTGKG
jgi:transcriptional regulator with XRE-family HTH domain